MTEPTEDRLAILDRLIAEAEEKQIELTFHIVAFLLEGKSTTKAEDGLRQITELLVALRKQRAIEQSQDSAE